MKLTVLKRTVEKVEETVVVVLFSLMCATVLFNVFNRSIFQLTVGWPDELSRYLMIWLTYFTVPIAFARAKHFKLSLLTTFVFKGANRIHQFALLGIEFSFAALFSWLGWQLLPVLARFGQKSTGMGLPMWIVYGIIPLSFLLVLVQTTINFLLLMRTTGEASSLAG